MNVQAIPVKAPSNGRNTGTKAAAGGNEDFLSILRKSSDSNRGMVNKKGQEPVKKKEKSAAKQDNHKEAEVFGGQMSQEEQMKSVSEADASAEKTESGTVRDAVSTEERIDSVTPMQDGTAAGNILGYAGNAQAEIKQDSGPDSLSDVMGAFMTGDIGTRQLTQEKEGEPAGVMTAENPAVYTDEAIGSDQQISVQGTSEGVVSAAGKGTTENQKTQTFQENQGLKASGMVKEEPVAGIRTSADSEGNGSQNSDTGDSAQSGKDSARWFSLDHGILGEKHPKTDQTSQNQETVSLEDLQKKAEQNAFLPFERMVGAKLSGGSMTQVVSNQGVTDATPLPDQLRAGIEQGVEKNLNQFTIRLKPEGLGEILVHMTSTGGKVSLSIGVSNLDTQKLLSSEMMHLKETLQPLHAEVQEIYHNSQGGMDMMSYEQGFFRNQQNHTPGTGHRRLTGGRISEEEEEADRIPLADSVSSRLDYGRLSAYI